jgi:hypothetical protein
MTESLDSEAKVRIRVHLPVSSQKSVNFEPPGYSLIKQAFRSWDECVKLRELQPLKKPKHT